MLTIKVTTRSGEVRSVPAEVGRNVMEILRDGGVDDILAVCGGCCSCATCHVYVDDAFAAALTPASADERDLLGTSDHANARSRLSCQLKFSSELDGLSVTVAPQD